LSDGPNGVRGTRFFGSVPSACLPCGTGIGATFDKDLVNEVGHLLADEAKAKGAHVILGPTINIQRTPLGGRGFESFSEDPILSGTLAASYCRGLEEKGITATPKHFVCNDMEHERMAVDSLVTERALREIYLMPFLVALRDGKPGAIMTSYNKMNGTHCSENEKLLQGILRGEWGWDGLVMSDWYVKIRSGNPLPQDIQLLKLTPSPAGSERIAHPRQSRPG
jgi:beta-glucosidase